MTRFITRAGFAIALTGLMTLSLASVGSSADEYEGNPSCTTEFSYKQENPAGTIHVDQDGLLATITVGTAEDGDPRPNNQNNAVVAVTIHSGSSVTSGTILVKGGPGAIGYSFSDPTPMHAPTLDNGKWPTISHVQLCWNEPAVPEYGRVEVTKVVTGDDAPTDTVFEITLTGPDDDPTTYHDTIEGAGTITFDDLQPGTYHVTETNIPDGFDVTYADDTIEVEAGHTTTTTITNTYDEQKSETPPQVEQEPVVPPTTQVAPEVTAGGESAALPVTGSEPWIALVAAALMAAGSALVLLGRRPQRSMPQRRIS